VGLEGSNVKMDGLRADIRNMGPTGYESGERHSVATVPQGHDNTKRDFIKLRMQTRAVIAQSV
jgi:hypothetical protein